MNKWKGKFYTKTIAVLALLAILIYNFFFCNYRKDYKKSCRYIYSDNFRRQFKYNDSLDKLFIANYLIKDKFNGVIINKYDDECNHGVRHIDFEDGDSLIFLLPDRDLLTEGNSFYNNTNIGDSISKDTNDSFFTVYSSTSATQYNLNKLLK
jgi:hypothetical protein